MFPYFDKVGNIRHLVTNYFILKVEIYCLRFDLTLCDRTLSALCLMFSSPKK